MKPTSCPAPVATTIRTLDLPFHRLVEVTYKPAMGLLPHAHAATSWAFVVDGDFASTTSTGLRRYSVNELGLLRAGMIHSNRYGPSGARCLIVENIRVDDITQTAAAKLSDAVHFPSQSPPAEVARSVYREFATRNTAADLVIDGLLTTMLAYAVRMNSGRIHSDLGDARIQRRKIRGLIGFVRCYMRSSARSGTALLWLMWLLSRRLLSNAGTLVCLALAATAPLLVAYSVKSL